MSYGVSTVPAPCRLKTSTIDEMIFSRITMSLPDQSRVPCGAFTANVPLSVVAIFSGDGTGVD